MAEKVLLIDANNLAFRVHWTHRHLSHDGMSVSLLYGFMRSMISFRARFSDYFPVIVWDGGSARRKEESQKFVEKGVIKSAYKANRTNKDDEDLDPMIASLFQQMQPLRTGLQLCRVLQVQVQGFEADDIIYSYAKDISARGGECLMVTSDKDYYQILQYPNATMYDAMKSNYWTKEAFFDMYGIDPALWVDVGALMGDGCFTGDTEIKMLDGTNKTMKQLSEINKDKSFWVYSCDKSGKIVPGLAKNPRVTIKNAPIFKVTLDNGNIIRCTGNHKFMLRSGEYKEASLLTSEDSLMPLYSRKDKFGYEEVLSNYDGSWRKTHLVVADKMLSHDFERVSIKKDLNAKFVIHHKDFNKINNEPENLSWMELWDHVKYHNEFNKEKWRDPKYREFMKVVCSRAGKIGGKASWENDRELKLLQITTARKNMTKEQLSRGIIKYNKSDINKPKARKNILEYHKSDKFKQKRSDAAKKRARTDGYRSRMSELGKITTRMLNGDPEQKRKQLIGRIKKIIEKTIVEYGVVNEEFYSNVRVKNQPTWSKAVEILGNGVFDVNHKVVSVEFCGYEDVYDFEVEEYHNFALSSGVFVHNSDNIFGVPGIGPTWAVKFVKEYGTIDKVVAGLEAKTKRSKKEQSVLDHKDVLYLAKSLKQMDYVPDLPAFRCAPRQLAPLQEWIDTYNFVSIKPEVWRLI